MAFVDDTKREINFKIVYWGTALCGKATNLRYIHENAPPDTRGPLNSLATETERRFFFHMPRPSLGQVNGLDVRLHLYAIPGTVLYDASRQAIFKGVDGVVFVADSDVWRTDANTEMLDMLGVELGRHGKSVDQVPLVLQYNKRDLETAQPIEELEATLNPEGRPHFAAVATRGTGVMETLDAVATRIVERQRTE